VSYEPSPAGFWKRYVAYLIDFLLVSAVLTPPDGLSQVLLAVPMCALYELGLLWARVLHRRPKAVAS
jgi:sec-independent protein translocase protein TatC